MKRQLPSLLLLFAGLVCLLPVSGFAKKSAPIPHSKTADAEAQLVKSLTEGEAKLPPEVARCSITADKRMRAKNRDNQGHRFDRFAWTMTDAGAWTVKASDAPFGDDRVAVDSVVTIHNGRVRERVGGAWKDATFTCGVKDGKVVATRLAVE
jgi:hypothetical protein